MTKYTITLFANSAEFTINVVRADSSNSYFRPEYGKYIKEWTISNLHGGIYDLLYCQLTFMDYEVKNSYSPMKVIKKHRRPDDEFTRIFDSIVAGLKSVDKIFASPDSFCGIITISMTNKPIIGISAC